MFETAVEETRSGPPWGVIIGLIAFVVLLIAGYFMVT